MRKANRNSKGQRLPDRRSLGKKMSMRRVVAHAHRVRSLCNGMVNPGFFDFVPRRSPSAMPTHRSRQRRDGWGTKRVIRLMDLMLHRANN